MNFLKSAASAVSAASKLAADSAKKTYADLKAPPTTVRCSACPLEVDVPATAFDWHCAAGHVSKRSDELCLECKVAQPAGLPEPTVTCQSCQAVTKVPLSNARKHAREAAVKTKEFAVSTAAATKAGVEHLRATPTTFHCAHCDTLLAVPSGPWSCQTCTAENEEEAKACKQCAQKKSAQKAICGVCRQSTVIPASNFADGLKHAAKDLSRGSKRAYFDISGKPYVTCNRCMAHVSVDKKDVSAPAPAAVSPGGRPVPRVEGEGANSAPLPSPAEEEQQAPIAPGGVDVQVEGTYNGANIVCPACKNPIEN